MGSTPALEEHVWLDRSMSSMFILVIAAEGIKN